MRDFRRRFIRRFVNHGSPSPTPPGIPVATASTDVTSSSFFANWEAVLDADSYEIQLATDAAFEDQIAEYFNLDVGNVTSIEIDGLLANTLYYFRLRAKKDGLYSVDYSNVIQTTTDSSGPVGLLNHWPLEQTEPGDNRPDIINGETMFDVSIGVNATTGVSGNAALFDGITCGLNASQRQYDVGSAFGISLYVKSDTLVASGVDGKRLFAIESLLNRSLLLMFNGDEFVGQVRGVDNTDVSIGSGTISDLTSYIHVVFTGDATGTYLYINKTLVATGAGIPGGTVKNDTCFALIGALTDPDFGFIGYVWEGPIDEVKRFESLLTQADVDAL